MKPKAKTNADFIEKLKTISILIHHPAPKCHDCAKPMQLIGMGIMTARRESKPKDERSFAE